MKHLLLLLAFAFSSSLLLAQGAPYGRLYGDSTLHNDFQAVFATQDGGVLAFGHEGNAPQITQLNSQGDTLWTRTYPTNFTRSSIVTVTALSDSSFIAVGGQYCAKHHVSGNVDWNYRTRSTANFIDARATSDGGYILAGNYYTNGHRTATLVKLDAQGDTLWTRDFFGGGIQSLYSVVDELPTGHYMVFGSTTSLHQNPPFVTRGFVHQYDAQGTLLWTKDFSRNVYLGTPTMDNGYLMADDIGEALLKLDANGDSLWTVDFSMLPFQPHRVRPMADGGFLLVGNVHPDQSALMKVDSMGQTEWSQTFSPLLPSGVLDIKDMAIDTAGDIVLVGEELMNTTRKYNAFWAKVSPQGQFLSVASLNSVAPLSAQLFPNPTTSTVTIALEQVPSQPLEAQLFTPQGQIVQQLSLRETTTTLELAELPTGIYFLNITDPRATQQQVYKIIKQ